MKLLCLILSVYVLMLSAKPCCADNDCQAKPISKKEFTCNQPVKEKECAGCSPFFTCGTCMGFTITKPFTFGDKTVAGVPLKIYADYQQPHIQQVLLSIWQPPQLG